jgi:hypothetical protein
MFTLFGAWRNMVARLLWEQEVAGSNPVAPTILLFFKHNRTERILRLALSSAAPRGPRRTLWYASGRRHLVFAQSIKIHLGQKHHHCLSYL